MVRFIIMGRSENMRLSAFLTRCQYVLLSGRMARSLSLWIVFSLVVSLIGYGALSLRGSLNILGTLVLFGSFTQNDAVAMLDSRG